MRQPVDLHANPLAYLRACGLEVSYDDNKIKLAPMVAMSAAVQQKAIKYATKHKDQLVADLSEEESYQQWRHSQA